MSHSASPNDGQPLACPLCAAPLSLADSASGGGACPGCGHPLWVVRSADGTAYAFPRFTLADGSIRNNQQAIATIVDALIASNVLQAERRAELLAAIFKREELGPTGIGRGVAIPHGRHSCMSRIVGAAAEFPAGVDFQSLDREPVRFVFLLLSPPDQPQEHMRVLEAVARRLRQGR